MNKRRTILVLLIAFLLAIPLLPLSPIQVLADNTGAKYPGTKTTQSVAPEDDVNWSNPANIGASDNSYATAALSAGQVTYRLKAQGFDFSAIPDGATIDGILVEIEKRKDVGSLKIVYDYRVQLLDASGSLVGDNKATVTTYPTSDTIISYGGAANKWNASPTAAMVKDTDFGVVLSSYCSLGSSTVYIDCIRITVYYTPPPEAPEVDTDACDEVTATSMQGNANITDDGGAEVTRRGFVYAEDLKYALDFNGVSDYVNVGTLGNFGSGISEGTINFWMATTQTSLSAIMGELNTGTATAFILYLNYPNVGSIRLVIRDNAGKYLIGSSTASWLVDGENHYVEVYYKCSTNTITIDIDGISQTITYQLQQTPATFSNFAYSLAIGAQNNAGAFSSYYYQGELDEIELDDGGFGGLWHLDEGTGSTTTDSSGNGNDGTITGADWVYQEWDLETFIEAQLTYTNAGTLRGGDVTRAGQKKSISGVITSLSFPIYKIGTVSGNVTFTIRDLADNILVSEVWGDASALPTTVTWETVVFNEPQNINEEVRLTVEYYGAGNDINGVRVHSANTDIKPSECWTFYNAGWSDTGLQEGAYSYTYFPSAVNENGSFSEGSYSLTIGGLIPETWYRVRGFAENSVGIGYGDVVVAQTLEAGHPYSWGYILGA